MSVMHAMQAKNLEMHWAAVKTLTANKYCSYMSSSMYMLLAMVVAVPGLECVITGNRQYI